MIIKPPPPAVSAVVRRVVADDMDQPLPGRSARQTTSYRCPGPTLTVSASNLAPGARRHAVARNDGERSAVNVHRVDEDAVAADKRTFTVCPTFRWIVSVDG